jgi:hypothetical protein
MRKIATTLALAGALLLAFGFWGTQSAAGHQRFADMNGFVPLAMTTLGGLLLITAAIIDMLAERRQRRASQSARRQGDGPAAADSRAESRP